MAGDEAGLHCLNENSSRLTDPSLSKPLLRTRDCGGGGEASSWGTCSVPSARACPQPESRRAPLPRRARPSDPPSDGRWRALGGPPSPPGPAAQAARPLPLSHAPRHAALAWEPPPHPAPPPWGSSSHPHALWRRARRPGSASPSFLGVLLLIHRVP